jgi:hypothetical protein
MEQKKAPEKKAKAEVKTKKLNEAEFKKLVRDMARKSILEHVKRRSQEAKKALQESKKPEGAKKSGPQKITVEQLTAMIRESVARHLAASKKNI